MHIKVQACMLEKKEKDQKYFTYVITPYLLICRPMGTL